MNLLFMNMYFIIISKFIYDYNYLPRIIEIPRVLVPITSPRIWRRVSSSVLLLPRRLLWRGFQMRRLWIWRKNLHFIQIVLIFQRFLCPSREIEQLSFFLIESKNPDPEPDSPRFHLPPSTNTVFQEYWLHQLLPAIQTAPLSSHCQTYQFQLRTGISPFIYRTHHDASERTENSS